MLDLSTEHIVATPDTCGGAPRVAGSRIRVQDIVVWHERVGMTVDEMVDEFEPITHADIYAALAYYWDHKGEIDRRIADEHAIVDDLRQTHVSRLPEARSSHRTA